MIPGIVTEAIVDSFKEIDIETSVAGVRECKFPILLME
jgi:hypothetical protein